MSILRYLKPDTGNNLPTPDEAACTVDQHHKGGEPVRGESNCVNRRAPDNVAKDKYDRQVSVISEKNGQSYSHVLHWIRCRVGLSILRASIICLWRAWSTTHHPFRSDQVAIHLALYEGKAIFKSGWTITIPLSFSMKDHFVIVEYTLYLICFWKWALRAECH